MWCTKCKNDLSECVCPDLKERLEAIQQGGNVFIAPRVRRQYEEQAERNKTKKTLNE